MPEAAVSHILIIEDDPDTQANLRDILELDGYKVTTATTIAQAVSRRDWGRYSTIILDRRLPDGRAEEFLPRLKVLAPDAGVIIVTGYADVEGAIAALRQGAADYLLKPINPEILRARLAQFVHTHRLRLAKERSDAAFRTLVESAPSLIVIFRPDHSILYFNPFAEELSGYKADEVVGNDFLELFIPEHQRQGFADLLERVLCGAPSRGQECQLLCKEGIASWIVWNAQLLPEYEGSPALLAVGQDITKLKLAQEQTLQSERLAAIGQMMTGLAHESGNALARSQACLEMLAMEVEDRPDALDLVARIQKAQDHLQQLYEEVRAYAAPLKLDREQWEVSAIWRQAWNNLAMARQGRTAHLTEHTDGVDLRCSVDPFRLEQVFRNILENALAACKDPVEIEICCGPAELLDRPALSIAVRDNGPGLNAEQKLRIFDPFF